MNRIVFLCLLWSLRLAGATPSLCSAPVLPEPTSLSDTIPPVITCPPKDTVQVAPGFCTAVVDFTVNYSDNLPGAFLIQASGLPSGSHFPIGNTVNLFVAVDAAGNTANCSFTVTVHDITTVLICKDLYYAKLDSTCSVDLTYDKVLDPGGFGCLSQFTIELDKTAPFGNGPWVPGQAGQADLNKTYQYRVTNISSGNRCWGNVKIVDSIKPYLTCAPIVVTCAVPSITPTFLKDSLGIAAGRPTLGDNCAGNLAIIYSDAVQNLPCAPASNGARTLTTRTWTATDAAGNTSACTQTITQSTRFADIHFPADITLLTCQDLHVPESTSGAPYFQAGTREYPVELATACHVEVNYYDTLMPLTGCPAYKRIRRTWKVFDLCSAQPSANPLVYVQNIDLTDQTGPVIQCPANVTISVSAPDCNPTVDLPDFIITDNCSRIHDLVAHWSGHAGMIQTATGRLTDFPANNPMLRDTLGVLDTVPGFPFGITAVTYVATDECGNTGKCTFNLHVWDQIPPVANCQPEMTVYLDQNGIALIPAFFLDNGSQDECNAVAYKTRAVLSSTCHPNAQLYDAVSLCCTDAGDTVQVTLRVYDIDTDQGDIPAAYGAGHYSECNVPVIVRDTLTPTCLAPAPVKVNCESFNPSLAYGLPTLVGCHTDSFSLAVDYTQFDTICKRGKILKTFQTFHQGVAGGHCSQLITVDYKQNYYVRFPDDGVVTTCNPAVGYGNPIFFGVNCERLNVSYSDEIINVVPDACFKINRTWTIYNGCTYDSTKPLVVVPNPNPNPIVNNAANLPGPVVSAPTATAPWAPSVVKVSPTDALATNFSTFWTANVNGYQYKQILKFIDAKPPVVQCPNSPQTYCDSTFNDPELWNESYWWDNTIALHDLCEGPVDLTISGTDLCSGSDIDIQFLLYLDLDADGIQETVISSTDLPGYNNVFVNNIGNPGYSGGSPRAFDERPVPSNQKYGFAMKTTTDGVNKVAAVRWNTVQAPNNYVMPQLPYGSHKIKWTITDKCGNYQQCLYGFVVKDCQKPEVSCVNGLSVVIGPDGTTPGLLATEILQSNMDNCTPVDRLQISVRHAGQGSDFPVDIHGSPVSSIGFTCADQGSQTVELWVRDKAGNAAYCTADITVLDGNSYCADVQPLTVQSTVSTESQAGVSGVDVRLVVTPYASSIPTTESVQTDLQGHYGFLQQVPPYGSYVITPQKLDGVLNGISTYDLVQISKHILGIQALMSPYKIIAADANRNGSVTTADIVEIRKLILGINDTFPHNTSWRFVDKNYVFPSYYNPFQEVFPEAIHGSNAVQPGFNGAFVAIKIGDVNGSASPNGVGVPGDRERGMVVVDLTPIPSPRGEGGLISIFPIDSVNAGGIVSVRFKTVDPLVGFQFGMNLEGLEVVEVVPGEGMGMDNFGVFKNAVTTSWNGDSAGKPEFLIRFRALKAGRLSEMIRLSDRITRAEAYLHDNRVVDVALRFNGTVLSGRGLELFQNTPNPFVGQTLIGYYLPDGTSVRLTVIDAVGRVLYEHKAMESKGLHEVVFEPAQTESAGVLYYRLETPDGTLVRKMLRE
jgi:hypothetical protein